MFSRRFALLAVVSVIAAAIADVAVAQEGDDNTTCVKGVAPPADGITDNFSEWPAMYRLTSPNPEDPQEPNFAVDDANNANGETTVVLVDPSVLAYAGVTYQYIDPTGFDYPNATAEIPWVPAAAAGGNNDPLVQQIRDDNDYQYADIIVVTNFIPTFWVEHLHEAPTIRYMLDGSGYFDLRDLNDDWVRIPVSAGDWFEWPAGIEHRFTVDKNNNDNDNDNEEEESSSYIQAMRLYKGSASPEWSAVPRSQVVGNNTARNEYVNKYLCGDDPDFEIVAIVAPVVVEEDKPESAGSISDSGAPSDAPNDDGGEEEEEEEGPMISTSAPTAAVIEGDDDSSSSSSTTAAPSAVADNNNMMEDIMDEDGNATTTTTTTITATTDEDDDQCSAHSQCAALELTGTCCPAADGVNLECCDNYNVDPNDDDGDNDASAGVLHVAAVAHSYLGLAVLGGTAASTFLITMF